MIDKPFAAIVGVATFIYVGSIFMEATPHARLAQTCAPVRWTGNIMGSIAALTDSDKLTQSISSGTDSFDYGCQFTLWRLMYGKTYSENIQQGQGGKQVAQQGVPGGVTGYGTPDQLGILPPGGLPEQSASKSDSNSQASAPPGSRVEKVMLVEKQKH